MEVQKLKTKKKERLKKETKSIDREERNDFLKENIAGRRVQDLAVLKRFKRIAASDEKNNYIRAIYPSRASVALKNILTICNLKKKKIRRNLTSPYPRFY